MLDTVSPARRRRSRMILPQTALIDRAGLRAKLAALHAGGEPAADLRKNVIALFRAALDQGRALAQKALETNGGGLACAGQLAHVEDELIRAIHEYVIAYIHPEEGDAAGKACVIAAVGGYGRATLAPGSDIDLLFLLPDSSRGHGERVVEAILYVLWDLGQKVGHSTRTVEECLTEAKADMTIRTALLEARLLLGDRRLFERMRTRFEREIVAGTAAEFVAAKLAERDARVVRAGRSRYLVEPNVKEGKGGLRDLNTLFWIAKYVYQVREAADLVGAGLFSRSEYRLFCRCEEFLWRVRCHLHFLTGRAEERLTFDHQRQIAARLGYSTRGGLASVERFMKHYFLIAKDVGDLTAIVCAALEEKQAKPYAKLDRFGPGPRTQKMFATGDFAIENGRVTVPGPEVFARDPVNLIRLFWVADRNGLAVHPDATRFVTLSLKLIDAKLREDAEANRLFLGILTSRNSPEIVLRLMNEAGVLGRFVPDFGRIVALMQFNMYHHYTVDEHLLRAVGNFADIEQNKLTGDHPLASEVLHSIGNRTAVILALFLHDIAKGRMEDHSLAGTAVARALCPRLGLSEADTETVAWLVENHLIMSDTAQRRDLGDRKTIATFANCVQTIERLKMLFIVTICDIRAVGPGVWNNWKAELLRTLYWETEVVLAGGHSTIDRKRRVAQARAELRSALPAWTDLDFEAYAARLPQAYWLKTDLAQKTLHAKLMNMTEVEMPGPVTHIVADSSRGVTELTVVAPDHPRLLSIIAGACAAAAANIVDAQAFTTTDGTALDTIFVSRAFDFDEDELRRAGRIAFAIEHALNGAIKLQDMVATRASQSSPKLNTFRLHPEVTIDNTLSNRFTVIEVSGLDRPGLLFDLTTILSRLDLNIASAHIATFGEKAADVFYVTDLSGAKITLPEQQELVRRLLLKTFLKPLAAAT
ncbi:[protein-PII] uridylyltransferase [Methylocapsa polymorpha]|uniref:Bifunctional uridylyltransferase/uridylyl-removing enzyme n=1 Tax=Methylocapsa polymorpha TaxID=3080828 RepID=A0ABZ0HXH7_9HYPH|nr:[protein-PII] uridylyltransferase [Methylocapsa sp. RX1]